jgi:hypothetical protein
MIMWLHRRVAGSEEIRPESCKSQAVDFGSHGLPLDSLHLGMAGNGRLGGGPGQGGYLEPAGIVLVVVVMLMVLLMMSDIGVYGAGGCQRC